MQTVSKHTRHTMYARAVSTSMEHEWVPYYKDITLEQGQRFLKTSQSFKNVEFKLKESEKVKKNDHSNGRSNSSNSPNLRAFKN